jgi:hypothetical protein
MENVTGRGATFFGNIIIVPIAIDTDVFRTVREKIQRRAGGTLVLVFVFAPGLRAGAFTWFDLTKPSTSAHHEFSLSSSTGLGWPRGRLRSTLKHPSMPPGKDRRKSLAFSVLK